MISAKNLDFWIENKLNVLLIGKHGVGKTAIILEAFKKHGLKYKYFSAATMDPWIDFLGVPKEALDKNGKPYIKLIRPQGFESDSVEAIFMDEYNRAPSKVRNAVMELIQFKSINGKKFKNLRFVWAAINPDDEEGTYNVEKIDPAQLDRFQIQVQVPYKPHKPYFQATYGEVGLHAIEWWNELPNNIKDEVSPRRLEYAIQQVLRKGDPKDVLPRNSNIAKFVQVVALGGTTKRLGELIKLAKAGSNSKKIKHELNDENLFADARQYLYKPAFRPLLRYCNNEHISSLILDEKYQELICDKKEKFEDALIEFLKANWSNKSPNTASTAATYANFGTSVQKKKRKLYTQALEQMIVNFTDEEVSTYLPSTTFKPVGKLPYNDFLMKLRKLMKEKNPTPKTKPQGRGKYRRIKSPKITSAALKNLILFIEKELPERLKTSEKRTIFQEYIHFYIQHAYGLKHLGFNVFYYLSEDFPKKPKINFQLFGYSVFQTALLNRIIEQSTEV